jgi:predicted secreted protein
VLVSGKPIDEEGVMAMPTTIVPRRGALALALLTCGLLCGRAGYAADNMPETRNAVLVGAMDENSTVKLTGKEHLVVTLPFRAGTGYSWKPKEEYKELRLMHHYLLRPARARAVGGERLAAFDFAPAAAGSCDVVIELHAPGGKVEKTFTIKVEVGESP